MLRKTKGWGVHENPPLNNCVSLNRPIAQNYLIKFKSKVSLREGGA